MKLAEVVLFGTVTDRSERPWKKDDRSGVIKTLYLAGARQVCEVTLPSDGSLDRLAVGDEVALNVYARTFNNRITYAAEGLWSGEVGEALRAVS